MAMMIQKTKQWLCINAPYCKSCHVEVVKMALHPKDDTVHCQKCGALGTRYQFYANPELRVAR